MSSLARSSLADRCRRGSRQARVRPNATCAPSSLAAAYLMGTWNQLALPRLDGTATEHHLHLDAGRLISIAANLVRLNIAVAEDWEKAGQDPTAYVELSLARWIDSHGGEAIRRRFAFHATLASRLDEFSEEDADERRGNRLYLVVEPESAAYVILGPTLELLEKIDRRLPVTFFRLLVEGLGKWVRVYDYRDAEERVEMLREWCEGEGNQGEYEFPDVAGCIPTSMKEAPLGTKSLRQLQKRLEGSAGGPVLARAMDLQHISNRAERPTFTDDMREQLGDANPPLPGMLAVFSAGDAIEACFDDEAQYAAEVPPEPNLIVRVEPDDPATVRAAFRTLGVVCETLAAASRLIGLMPGNEAGVAGAEEE
jgi:hypothetical protein